MSWWITILPSRNGFTAWASETQPPRDADGRTMIGFPGEVHFEFGCTAAAARDALERSLPPRPLT